MSLAASAQTNPLADSSLPAPTSCPICFRSIAEGDDSFKLARLSQKNHTTSSKNHCEHALCCDCWERLLLRDARKTPTISECPVCRAPVSYFDLVYCSAPESSDDKKDASGANGDDSEAVTRLWERKVHVDDDNDSNQFPAALHGAIFHSPLEGIGAGSFHFPARPEPNQGQEVQPFYPFCDMSAFPGRDNMIFSQDQHYHSLTHTWQGVCPSHGIRNHQHPNQAVKVVLSFNADFSFIRRGVVILLDSDKNDNDTTNIPRRNFMDGRWLVVSKETPTATSTLQQSLWSYVPPALQIASNSWGLRLPTSASPSSSGPADDYEQWCYRIDRSSTQQQQQSAPCVVPRHHQYQLIMSLLSATTDSDTAATAPLWAVWDWNERPDGPVVIGDRVKWWRYPGPLSSKTPPTVAAAPADTATTTTTRREQPPDPPAATTTPGSRWKRFIPGNRRGSSSRKDVANGAIEEDTVVFVDTADSAEIVTSFNHPLPLLAMEWERVSPLPAIRHRIWWELGGKDNAIYQRYRSNENNNDINSKPTFARDSLWGNTFSVGGAVGLASYHFVQNENNQVAYLSLEHSETSMWPPLDNGAPLPCRVFFRNVKVAATAEEDADMKDDDETSLGHHGVYKSENDSGKIDGSSQLRSTTILFSGTLDFLQDCQTTWQGMERCEVQLRFDPYFLCVTGRGSNLRPIFEDDDDDDDDVGNEDELANVIAGLSLQCYNAALLDELRRPGNEEDGDFPFLSCTTDEDTSLQTYLHLHGASPAVTAAVLRLLEQAGPDRSRNKRVTSTQEPNNCGE